MSILETFYILFKSDASDVKKGADEAEKSTKQLTEGLKGASDQTKKIGDGFVELLKSASAFIGIGAALHEVFSGIKDANAYALQLSDASRALGVNASALDAWGNAVKEQGGSVEGFQQSLRNLSQHFGASANVALQTLPQLADVFSRLGRFRSIQYGKMLGLDESTILLLQQGRREVEAVVNRQKELGTVNEKNTDIARKYRIANIELDTAFRALYLSLGQVVIPLLTKFYNVLTPGIEYLKNHSDLVIGAFIGIGAAAAVMLAPFIVASAPILATALAISLLIAAVAIAYEDVHAFLNGQNSLIGDLLKKWPVVGELLNGIFDSWRARIKFLTDVFKAFKDIVDKISGFMSGDSNLQVSIGDAQDTLGVADNNLLTPQSSQAIFNARSFSTNRAINTGPITIHTQATDANGIAQALGKGLNAHLAQANNDIADGVAY